MNKEFTPAEKAELALIYEIVTKVKKASDRELKGLVLDEMDKKQPALQNLARFLYMEKKFSMEQMMDITRLLILIWLYYKDRLRDPSVKIADPLYVEMRKKHESLMDEMNGKNAEHNKSLLVDHLKVYPGRFLYGQIQHAIFHNKSNKLSTLSRANKAYLLSHLKIIMDCFESLTVPSFQ
ncbi:MAG: hypothetical protein J0H74_34860 [Chitinophagaceae bacterium]|nr:hypothetical protein [Chitinophagaceae bacterium]